MDDDVLASARPATVAVAAGRGPRLPGGPLNPPLTGASAFHALGEVDYAREGHPTWEAFEEAVGALEGGRAVAFSSGMAAVAAVLRRVPVGGTVVAPHDAYTGFRALADDLACDGADLLWVETPTNPLLVTADLPALVEGGHARGLVVAVDSTFATPLRRRPLDEGADVVVHSATKMLGGHSDLLLGVAVTRQDDWWERLHRSRALDGATPGALEAWLALRGLRSLPVRLDRAESNAGELARRLGSHPAVTRVRYPGSGTIVSFETVGGRQVAEAACAGVRLVVHATSFGGVETSMERRGRHPGEERLPETLIRLSAGCEHVDDLWDDLARALDEAVRGGTPA
jgi:cystathionine gamma-synthase